MEIRADHIENIRKIKKAITKKGKLPDAEESRFNLIIAEFNHFGYRDDLIRYINTEFPNKAITIEVSKDRYPTFEYFEEKLEKTAKEYPIIHLKNDYGQLFGDAYEKFFYGLNLHREKIAEIAKCTIFLWLYEKDVKIFATTAADMWAWRSGVFEFIIDISELEEGWVKEEWLGIEKNAFPKDEKKIKSRINELETFISQNSDASEKTKTLLKKELASLLIIQGYYDKALVIAKEILDYYSKINELVELGKTYNDLAIIEKSLGNFRQYEKYRIKSIEILELNLPADSKELGVLFNNLAIYYAQRKIYDKARKYNDKALTIFEKRNFESFGEFVNLALAFDVKARICEDENKFDESEKYYLRALKIINSANNLVDKYENFDLEIIQVQLNYAKFLEKRNRIEEAQGIYNETIATLDKHYPSNIVTAAACNQYSQFLYKIGNIKEAYKYITKAKKIAEKLYPKDHPDLENILQGYSIVKSEYDRYIQTNSHPPSA